MDLLLRHDGPGNFILCFVITVTIARQQMSELPAGVTARLLTNGARASNRDKFSLSGMIKASGLLRKEFW